MIKTYGILRSLIDYQILTGNFLADATRIFDDPMTDPSILSIELVFVLLSF